MKWRHETPYSVVSIEGKLILDGTDQLKNEIKGIVEDKDIKQLIVDLSAVDFIDSTGIGMLISLYKYQAERHAGLVVVSNHSRVDKVIEITKLGLILPCLNSLDSAVDHIQSNGMD